MAKGFQIAEGYLDIEADVDGALKNVRSFFKEVEGELGAVEKEFKKGGQISGEQFADGVAVGGEKGAKKLVTSVSKHLGDEGGEVAKAGEKVGEEFTKTITESIKKRTKRKGKGILDDLLPGDIGGGKGFFSGLLSGAGDFFSSFSKGFVGAFSSGIDGIKTAWSSASTFFQQASNVLGGVGSVAQIAGMAALIPIVLALGGALIQLSAALFAVPAAVGVLIAIIAPLMIAMKGFGEAVGAGLSGDVDKFNEALKGLAPNARKVAKEFVALGPALKQIKNMTQNAFWAPLIGGIKPLAKTFLPLVASGFEQIAGSLGRVVRGFLNLLVSQKVLEVMGDLFGAVERIVDRIGPSIVNLFGGLFDVMGAGLPWVEKFFGVLSDGINTFAGWLSKISGDGTLQSWLARAWEIGTQLWDLFKEVGGLVATLFGNTGDEGSNFIVSLTGQVQALNKYLSSKNGQDFINLMADLIQVVILFGRVAVTGIMLTGKAITGLVAGVKMLWHWLVVAWDWIAAAIPAAGHWFADLGRTIWSALVTAAHAVADFFIAIGQWFASAWGTVTSTGGAIIGWFAALPGRIWAWLQSIPGILRNAFMQAYDATLFQIGRMAGTLVKFWTVDLPGWVRAGWIWAVGYVTAGALAAWQIIAALPGQIWGAMQNVALIIGNAFRDAWNWAWNYTTEGISRAWERMKAFPGQLVGTMSQIGATIWNAFVSAWNQAKSATSSGIESVMSFIRGLQGKITNALSGAGTWLYDTGMNMINGLVNGIEDALSWAVGAAKRAAQKIKDGFLSALDVHSPSQVMRIEVGRQLLPGVIQGIDDTLPGMNKYLGTVSPILSAGMNPNINVGGPSLQVNQGRVLVMIDGTEVAAAITLDPTKIAAASAEGGRQRGWAYSARGTR